MGRSKAIVLHQEQQHEYHHQQHQQHQQQHPQQQQPARSRDVMSQRPANIRIRRAILAGKRGPTTPVPSWKLYENPSYDGIMAGTEAAGRQITISARKLAATLWELQELPLCPRPAAAATTTTAAARRPSRSRSRSGSGSRPSQGSSRQQRESVGSPKHLMLPPPSPTTPVPHNATTNQRRSPYSDSATYRASEDTYASETPRQSFEVESQKQAQQQQQDTIDDDRDCARNSTDLLKLLSQIRGMDQAPPGSTPLAAVLRLELEHTRQRVRELEQANRAARRDIESLLERTETERSAWRAREQERWRSAVVAAKQEAEEEKRQKRRSEHRARKLAAQLAEVNSALARAVAEAERERKARQLMEEVCDELAREIGQDKAEVEELKRESEKVREEVEEERRMLQMAEVWREERVQMKLAEARHELEEKNSVLDRLRGELEDFLRSKPGSTAAAPPPQSPIESSELQKASNLRAAMDSLRKPKVGAAAAADDADDDDDDPAGSSAEEDLHSIDLNKESLYDRTQGNRWTSGKKQEQADEQAEKRPEPRRKGFRGRRRLRRPRTHDESSLGPNRSCPDGFGPSSRKIETIPEEQQQELYMENGGGGGGGGGGRRGFRQGNPEAWSDYEDDDTIKIDARDDDDFALEYTQHRRSQDGSTPTLSPLLHSASFPLSSVATPQRNSWSSGDLNQSGMRGFGDWQRSSSRDNSLRAKLLEAKIMEERCRE